MKNLTGKKILLIICGGISAYKSLELIRLFKKQGSEIKTILTKSAKEFVTPLSVASLTQEKVYDDLFNAENEAEMDHISLSRWADLILVAPATANTISKLSVGSSDDLASTVILASDKDIFLVPAMNVRMWEHPSTRENLNKFNRLNIKEIADLSINDTLARTIITSVTTLLALLSIFILGGEILKGFSFAMILGVVIGTYSSIFVASPMLKFFKVTYKTLEKEEEKIVP